MNHGPAIYVLATLLLGGCGGSGDGETDTATDMAADTWMDTGMDVHQEPDASLDGPEDTQEEETPAGCPWPDDLGTGDSTIPIEHDSMARTYHVHVPPGYDPSVPSPVVFNLHGYGSQASEEMLFSDMNTYADDLGYIVVYPEGYENSWNGGLCCGDALLEDVDDVGFIRAVVQDVSTRLCVDPERIYASGMSNGGFMSYRLACEASDLFAGAAPVAGALGVGDCSPDRPIPLMAYHGTVDSRVDYSDGEASFHAFAVLSGCTGDPVRTMHETSYCDVYEDCDGGVQVGLCTLDGMDHCWPGGPTPRFICETVIGDYSEDINANVHMWEFFQQFVE